MTSLTKKQIRDAAPTDTLPYRVERKYGDPVLYGKPADVKNALRRDLDELRSGNRYRSPADLAALERIEVAVNGIGDNLPAACPLVIDEEIDDYTGVRYQVTVTDRRRP